METTTLTFNVPTITRRPTNNNYLFTIRLTNILFTCVLLSSVITCVRTAPSPKVYQVPQKAQLPHSNYDDNPCGVNSNTKAHRHSRSTPSLNALKRLERHLITTLNDFNHLNESKISIHYKDLMSMSKHFVDSYLPMKQLAKYRIFKKNHSSFSQQQMVEHILVDLRGKLKFYGKAFHKLSTEEYNLSFFSTRERTFILEQLGAKLRALRCEVETCINATNSTGPAIKDSALTKIDTMWPTNPGATDVMTLDMSTFTLYKTFLQDWVKVQRDVRALNHKRQTRATKSSNKRRIVRPKSKGQPRFLKFRSSQKQDLNKS